MKATITCKKEIEIDSIELILPVRYEEEDIPNDFPLRNGEIWRAVVQMDTGQITDWPKGQKGHIEMKVCDEGRYVLRDAAGQPVATMDQEYVPHGVVPGEYGDYVNLNINSDGIIANWPQHPDVSAFFRDREQK